MEEASKLAPNQTLKNVDKGLLQSDELYQYVLETSVYPIEPELLKELREATASHPMRASGLVRSLHSECLDGCRYAFLNTTAQACTCDCITDGLFSIAGYCTNIHKHNERNIDLSYSTDETSLRKEFSSFGQVIEVKLFKDESTERSRGFAFVQYTCQDDAMLAIENLDRKRMHGRVVYVELAKPMNFRFAAYPRTSGPPTSQHSKNEICSEESSNGEMP